VVEEDDDLAGVVFTCGPGVERVESRYGGGGAVFRHDVEYSASNVFFLKDGFQIIAVWAARRLLYVVHGEVVKSCNRVSDAEPTLYSHCPQMRASR